MENEDTEKKGLGEQIAEWRNRVGFDFATRPDTDPIEIAMSLTGADVRSMELDELGEHLVTLDGYYTYLNSEMGKIFSRVQFSRDATERIKLNQIKPFTEAVKVKIDLYKKIYDRKVREAKWRAYDATSNRG